MPSSTAGSRTRRCHGRPGLPEPAFSASLTVGNRSGSTWPTGSPSILGSHWNRDDDTQGQTTASEALAERREELRHFARTKATESTELTESTHFGAEAKTQCNPHEQRGRRSGHTNRNQLADGDRISRAAQRHRLNVIKMVPRFSRPYFEFFCARTGAMVFCFFPRTSDCTFDVRGDGGRVTKSVRVRNVFDALKTVTCRNDIVVRGKIEQPWKSPTRRDK
jgi:hypothetical protein